MSDYAINDDLNQGDPFYLRIRKISQNLAVGTRSDEGADTICHWLREQETRIEKLEAFIEEHARRKHDDVTRVRRQCPASTIYGVVHKFPCSCGIRDHNRAVDEILGIKHE